MRKIKLIVVGSNLNQRSFSDMKHSGKTKVIKVYYDALSTLSGQGFRFDLLNIMNDANSKTYVQVEHKLKTRDKIAAQFGLSSGTLQRYIRLTFLIPELLDMLEKDKTALVPVVNVSFLTKKEQKLLFDIIKDGGYFLKLRSSADLKVLHNETGKLSKDNIIEIHSGHKTKEKLKRINIY